MAERFTMFHNVLSFAGITIFSNDQWDSRKSYIHQIINVFIGFLTFIFTSGFCFVNVTNLPMFIEGACIWTTGLIMFISLCVCLKFRLRLREYLKEMAFIDAIYDMPIIKYVDEKGQGSCMKELKELVVNSQEFLLKLCRWLLKIYVGSVFVTATLYLLGAIYHMFTREDVNERILAFEMWFPWSLDDYRVYIASFTFHAYAGYLCCVAYPGFQSTIVLLDGQVIRQLRILEYILRNLGTLAQELVVEGQGREWQETCSRLLKQCVQQYIKLKNFSNRLNRICQPFYFVLIFDAIMLVCVCSVKIATSNKLSSDVIKYYVHEFCFIMVVMMFCLLGQQIQNECERLEEAVFERWYMFDLRHRKHLMIFNMALAQRMPIYIFGSITLSLPTFTWFIKTGASFFTLMMSFLEEAK